ncbi:MAG: chromate transporter [Bryobacteraceae bacterium]|jgi:chromate transporter
MVTVARLGWVYLRIGNTTFGGGNPTMAALQRELIERKGWIRQDDFALAYSLARITPGTNLLAFCAATGARILGLWGALVAVLAISVPSTVLTVLITAGYETWRSNASVTAAVGGTVAAVVGMMWASVWLLVSPHLRRPMQVLRALIFTGGAFLAVWKLGLTPVQVIALAALLGFLWKEPAAE